MLRKDVIITMIEKKTIGDRFLDIFIVVSLWFWAIIMVYPMLYELFVSFSAPADLYRHRGPLLWFLGFDTSAYQIVLSNPLVLSGYKNTLFLLVFGLAISIFLTALGAYCLSRVNLYWHRLMTVVILITMYFSGGLIPTYLTVRQYGLDNSLWALILPTAISTYNMIVLRSYFASIPESLVESVFIDGGNHFTVLFKIFIPLSLPAMAVMILYYGVGYWNSWFNANIYLRDQAKFPLQLVLRNILITGSNLDTGSASVVDYEMMEQSIKASMVIVSTLPVLAIYPFLQKYFVGGIMVGSLKG